MENNHLMYLFSGIMLFFIYVIYSLFTKEPRVKYVTSNKSRNFSKANEIKQFAKDKYVPPPMPLARTPMKPKIYMEIKRAHSLLQQRHTKKEQARIDAIVSKLIERVEVDVDRAMSKRSKK